MPSPEQTGIRSRGIFALCPASTNACPRMHKVRGQTVSPTILGLTLSDSGRDPSLSRKAGWQTWPAFHGLGFGSMWFAVSGDVTPPSLPPHSNPPNRRTPVSWHPRTAFLPAVHCSPTQHRWRYGGTPHPLCALFTFFCRAGGWCLRVPHIHTCGCSQQVTPHLNSLTHFCSLPIYFYKLHFIFPFSSISGVSLFLAANHSLPSLPFASLSTTQQTPQAESSPPREATASSTLLLYVCVTQDQLVFPCPGEEGRGCLPKNPKHSGPTTALDVCPQVQVTHQ